MGLDHSSVSHKIGRVGRGDASRTIKICQVGQTNDNSYPKIGQVGIVDSSGFCKRVSLDVARFRQLPRALLSGV